MSYTRAILCEGTEVTCQGIKAIGEKNKQTKIFISINPSNPFLKVKTDISNV